MAAACRLLLECITTFHCPMRYGKFLLNKNIEWPIRLLYRNAIFISFAITNALVGLFLIYLARRQQFVSRSCNTPKAIWNFPKWVKALFIARTERHCV